MPTSARAFTRGQQRRRAGDRLSNPHIARAIRLGGLCDPILRRSGAHRTKQPAQPLAARLFQRQLAARDERVQLLEMSRVQLLEVVERTRLELRMCRVQLAERGTGAQAMVEERVVEIEEDRAQHLVGSDGAPAGGQAHRVII